MTVHEQRVAREMNEQRLLVGADFNDHDLAFRRYRAAIRYTPTPSAQPSNGRSGGSGCRG